MLFLASVFGPLLFILGIWMLMYTKNLSKITTSLRSSPGSFWMVAFVNLLVGLVIINMYNVWAWDASFFVTLLGWVMTIRGILALFIPKSIIILTMKNEMLLKFMGCIPFVWGLILIWVAFLR